MQILFIDDNPGGAELARVALKDISDVNIDFVTDFDGFKEAFDPVKYQAIVSDYQFVGEFGSDLLTYTREYSQDIPFIIISRSLTEDQAVEILTMGATDYVLKETLNKLPIVLKRAVDASSQKAQNRMLGLSMHDIMSPITAINGYLDLMNSCLNLNDEKNPIAEYSRQIQRGVTDISVILHQLRETSRERFDAGTALIPFDVDLNWIAEEVSEIMQGAAYGYHHELVFQGFDRPVYVSVDLPHVKRIIYNFISNSMRYTPEGGKIQVSVKEEETEAILSITDNGIGIPEDKLASIFEMHQCVNNVDLYNKRSTGLGLFVNAELAKKLGGRIRVESRLGMGTTFHLHLPVSMQFHTSLLNQYQK